MIKIPIGVVFIVWGIATMYAYLIVGMFDHMIAGALCTLVAYVVTKLIVRWLSGVYDWAEREVEK